jgi:hypothetical protein
MFHLPTVQASSRNSTFTDAPRHVECGSLLPPFAARACPGVLLVSTWEGQFAIGAFGFHVAHPAFTEWGFFALSFCLLALSPANVP